MAFDYTKWQRWSAGFDLSNNAMWNYTDRTTAVATIVAADFFLPQYANLSVGDLIWIVASDVLEGEFAQVTAVSSTSVTVSVFNAVLGVGSVGTNNLAANAVTTAKITDANVTSAKLAADTIQYAQVAMTAAEWNGMYASPKLIIAAPGAGKIIQVDNAWYDYTHVAASYAAGGVVNLQYDSTANGAGVLATQDVAAATITGLAATSIVRPAIGITAIAQSTTVNKGLYMSNKTAAFTTGDGTWKINVAYRVITA